MNRSTMMTSNRPLEDWGKPNDDLAQDIVPAPDQVIAANRQDFRLHSSLFKFGIVARTHPPDSHHLMGRPYPDRDIPLLI